MSSNITKGDNWPTHYRGTRYRYGGHDVWWQTHKDGLKVHVVKGHERIVKELLTLKKSQKNESGGSFRITETGDVITKIQGKDGGWKAIFVCEMDEPFQFEEKLDTMPTEMKPGDLWPGFYDGARYSYLMNKLWWNNPEGPRQYVEEELPFEIIRELRLHKPQGGSFRITENGYVITLIPKQPLHNYLKKQWDSFSHIQQRLIQTKVQKTDMLPVYIGKYHEGIMLKPPVDFSKPLSTEEREEMLAFLDGFSFTKNTEFDARSQEKTDPENIDIEFRDDPEDWE